MANTPNVELEAAKFLHKLIQESKDEPTKLATKLYVILQHMRSSGKENSMPYQVISRAMETVIKQHNLDIEALMSSRLPVAAGAQVGDSSSSQLAGSSQRAGVANNAKASLPMNEVGRPDGHASSRGQVGPSSGGQDIYRGKASHTSVSTNVHGATPGASGSYPAIDSGISNPMHFGSSSYENHGFAPKMQNEKITESYSATPSFDLSASKSTAGKAVDHEGGTNTIANKAIQGGVVSNATETSMLKSVAPRDAGKSPTSSVPFKEQQLRQLRAQCLVFLAFRNGLMPKKLHLEIALGNILPKDDVLRREQSVNDPSSLPEVTRPFGRVDTARETDRMTLGSSSAGILAETNQSKGAENSNVMDDRSGLPTGQFENVEDGKHHFMTKKPEAEETTESQSSAPRGLQPDSNTRGLAVSYNRNDLRNTGQLNGTSNQASFSMGTGHARKDNFHNQSPAECNFQASRFAESNLPSFQSREQWTPISGVDGQNPSAMPVKDTDTMMNNLSQVQESDPEEEDNSISTDRPPSPKYTTVDRWILDRQKRKILTEQKWAQKQQKTEKKIAACFDKLKESVSSSEDIFAKTKSVIELKKLQLLELQRRLRSDILNDFFKPIATDMDRLKSIKKHRIGRKSKQLERYEQRMKEERQKRFRERQKEFFGEIEVHRERLEDIFKMRRERWKGFNRYVREFHKRKERIHREKIDRIQREKINLLKINDVEGYLRMVQDAKSDRVKQLLKETEKYLSKLGAKLQEAKVMTRRFETEMDESRSTGFVETTETAEDEDDTDQAKHYLESNEKYYMMAHSIKENITEQPACLVGGKLREYQMNGLRWLVSLYNNHLNGILADEMGLGKTVQVISLICYLMENKNDRGPFLVVVPSSVLSGWESEINFWAPSIHKIVYSGPPEERRRLFKEQIVSQKFNVLLTTYEYLMNKHDRPKLSKVHWHYIIIDEGHRIKNASCKLNADLKHYRSNHRLLLTGTPLQNNLEELWALLNFLLPNIFNSSEDFSQWFNKPFESNGDNSLDEALLSEEENLLIINRLHQVLRPFVLRRLKHKVENQLPEKIERLVRCEASAYQKLLMKRVEENLGAFGTSKARSVHNSVMELRNICNHPYLSQIHVEEVHDLIPKHYLPNVVRLCGKLEMLDRLLPKLKATDHRVLLFSTMTRLLDVMEDYLYWKQYKYLRLDGHTSGGERGALIDLFNQPNSPFFIFLLSIRAGGVGVNLQAADTVIIFDTDWNPQVDLQAQARAHRIGQKKDVLVLRLETVQTVEEQVRAAAEHKLGVANQSITAGFFDNNTSAEDRREYLESLLRECKKEEAAPVLDDDALNDLIARSESEIDIFESVDKRRREEEMAAWKQLITEKGAESSPLPPRLLTDDDLRAFYEVMKITEAPHPGVASTAGVKRKGEYLGGLDTQQYGRGKRAREVRSYEEQWTEEEFEKMCQVDSSGSPNYKDPNTEKKLASVTSGSVVATGEKLEPALPQPHLQPPFEPTGQQIKEVPPPSKRGRGRPKRTVTAVNIPAPVAPATVAPAPVAPAPMAPAPVAPAPMAPAPAVPAPMAPAPAAPAPMAPAPAAPAPAALAPAAPAPVALAALSGVSKIEAGSSENTSSHTMLHGPDSFPSNTPRRSITGNINQVGVSAAPSPQSSSLPSVGPASQSTHFSTPVRGRGRGRKAQTGEAARRRGKRQNLVLQDVPVTSMPSESEKPEIEKQGVVIPSSSTAYDPISVSCSATPGEASKEPNAVAPIPVLQSSSVTEKVNVGAQQKSNLSSSVVPDPESFPGFPAVIGTGKEDHGIRIAPASELSTSLPSVIPASQTILFQSEPKQGRGRGRKPQVGGEAPCRRGKRQEPATPIVISGSADRDLKSIEPQQKRSRVSAGRRVSARNKQDNEPQILTPSIQSNTAQTTSDPAIGHVHNGEQENESQEKRNDAKSDTSRDGTNPAVEHVSVAAAEHDITVMKDIPHESPLSEIKKDASSRSENIDSQATPPSSSNEVSKGPSLCGETSSAVSSESTAQNSVLKNGENGSQPRQKGREKDPQQLTDAIKSADPSTGKISDVDVENHTTATKEIKCQIVLPETAMKESLGGESRGTPNLPSSSKTCIEDVKGQLLDDSHTSASIVGSEVLLEKVADEMPESQVRKENGENAVLQDKVADEMHETQARKGNGEKNVRVDNATNDISESQARNKDARKEGQMHNPLVDRTLGVLALSAPTSHLSLVQSDSNMGKLRDQEKEDPALAEVLVSNLPTMDAAPPSINNALNNSGDLSAKEERLHQESEDPASCDVSGSNVDIPASVDTCCGDVKDHTLDDTSASTLRSSDIADTTTDKMCEGQANKEDMEKEGLMQNTCVNETSDMLPPSEPISDLSLVRAESHSGKLQDQEKEKPALTEVLVSSFPTSETAPPSTDIALNNSGDLSVKEDILDQDSKVSAPCDAPRLNSDLLASTETCGGAVKDQTLDDTTASALKSSAIVDSITNEKCKGQDNKDDVEKEGQVQNPPMDETSALLAPSAPASDLSLLQADSHSGKLEDQEIGDTNLPTTDDAPPNSNIALDNSSGELSAKEDRIDQDQALDETSASTFRSSNMVDGTTDETHEAQADKGDMEKEGLMQNVVVGETSDMLAPSEPASDLSSVPADSPSRKLEAQEKEDPALTDVLVSSVPTSETAPSNIDIALNDPEDLSVRVDQESKDSAPCDVPGLNSHLPTSVETGSRDVPDQSLDNNSASTLRSAATVDSTVDEMCEGQASKEVVENEGQLQNPSVDKTSVLSVPSPHASDSSLIPAESHSGKLKDQEKEHPAPSEGLVSDLPITDSALPSINIALDNSRNVFEKEDSYQESKEPTPCDVSGSDDNLPASVETCWGDVKDQPLDDNSESALRSSATVDSSTDELCEGQVNKEDMEKDGQMQNTVVDSALLAPIAPASDLLSVAADSHLGKMEDQEKEDPAPTEVLVPSLPTMETAPPITEIPLNNSEDPSAKEDSIDQVSKNSAPCDAPGLRLDLPASFETCSGDVKAQSPDDTSAPGKSAATIDSSTDKKCGSLASEEEGEKEAHEQNPLVDETPSMLAPGTPASGSLLVQVDSHSEKPEDREKKDTAVNEDLTSSLPTMGTSPASVEIAVNSSVDPSGKEDRVDEESKDSSPCHIPELKPDLPVSIQSCTEDVEDQTLDGSHASTSTLSSACVVDSTTTESCKGQAGEEDGGKVGEVKESAEALASDLLRVGDHSHCEESEEEEKKDPARSEVLDSSTLPITEPATPSDGTAPNNSDSLPEEQNRTDEEHKDSALEVSDVAMNESSQKNLLSTSPTSRPEASSLGSPENVSAKEVEEEKNRTPGVDGSVSSKSEATEIDNSCGEGGDPPTL